ncbi:MAG: hypothetical protein IPK80_10355 [Nannocystis sp.]|nr:hypothetical protein [Nannocystis sp.]
MSGSSSPEQRFAASREARPCAECTVCCTVMEVRELGKPGGRACPHLCASGCGIYEARPPSCQRFDCLWRLGFARDEDRPDQFGVMFEIAPPDQDSKIQAVIAFEATAGALDDERVRYQLQRHAKRHLIVLVRGRPIGLMGPRELIGRWQQSRSRAALGL